MGKVPGWFFEILLGAIGGLIIMTDYFGDGIADRHVIIANIMLVGSIIIGTIRHIEKDRRASEIMVRLAETGFDASGEWRKL